MKALTREEFFQQRGACEDRGKGCTNHPVDRTDDGLIVCTGCGMKGEAK